MSDVAVTPKPPYYAVIFTSLLAPLDECEREAYTAMAARMLALAAEQPGFLGVESARDGLGITVSYWRDLAAIRQWKDQVEHREAQRMGRERWYATFKTRIAKVEREYGSNH